MNISRFQTDWRLGIRIALCLFLVSWFLPVIGPKDEFFPPVFILYGTIVDRYIRHVYGAGAFSYFIRMVAGFAVVSFLISVLCGWLLQLLVVIMRTKKRERQGHGA